MERLTLSFNTVRCVRCGVRRQTRFPCPECGKPPTSTEIDINVQTRQRAIQKATAARSGAVTRLGGNAMDLLESGALTDLSTRIFSSADTLASEGVNGSEQFAAIAKEVRSLELWADETVSLRPLVTVTRYTQSVIRSRNSQDLWINFPA